MGEIIIVCGFWLIVTIVYGSCAYMWWKTR